MVETLKIIIPMAGLGTRLRPHTWSKPKPLIALAGRTVLDFLLDSFKSIPLTRQVEYIFIIGKMGEQIKEYIDQRYPEMRAHYVIQSEMRGQSDAITLAKEHLYGPIIIAFADTLAEIDFTILNTETADAITWVKPVEDPRRFGVAEIDPSGYVRRLIEKPQDMKNNLALVGIYYFREGQKLNTAIEEQIKHNISLHGEYYLADAVNILIEKGVKIRAQLIDVWLDAGTLENMLTTNQYLLEHGQDNSADAGSHPGLVIIPPVFIHPDVEINSSVVGPNVSISAGCHIDSCVLRNVIIEECAVVKAVVLENSILGRNTHINGKVTSLNIGDQSQIVL